MGANSELRKSKLISELTAIEKSLDESHKNSKKFQENRDLKSIKKNTKYFYKYAKNFSKIKEGIGPFKNDKNEYVYDNKLMAEMLSEQYASVFSKKSKNYNSAYDIFPEGTQYELDNINLTNEMFLEAISELSFTSSAGPEGMPSVINKMQKGLWPKYVERITVELNQTLFMD